MVIAYLVQSFITLWYDLAKWYMYIVLPFRQVMITAKYNLIYLTKYWTMEKERLIISKAIAEGYLQEFRMKKHF